MKLTAHYYRQHDADQTAEVPAESFLGWAQRELEVPKEQSALVMTHVWNDGLDDRLPSIGPGSPYAGVYRFAEYVPRAIRITREVLPPLLAAARAGGLTVIHLSDRKRSDLYAGGALARAAAVPTPAPMAGAPESPIRDLWNRERSVQYKGERNLEALRTVGEHADFAPQAMPLDNEPVVATTEELTGLCRARGIWHLIYAGFCIGVCIFLVPGAMFEMRRLGYVCSIVRDATTAVENHLTARDELGKQVYLWQVASFFGYAFDSKDLVAALQARE